VDECKPLDTGSEPGGQTPLLRPRGRDDGGSGGSGSGAASEEDEDEPPAVEQHDSAASLGGAGRQPTVLVVYKHGDSAGEGEDGFASDSQEGSEEKADVSLAASPHVPAWVKW